MSSHECPAGHESASQAELDLLFRAAKDGLSWLGNVMTDGMSVSYGNVHGIPVSDGPISYQLDIPGAIVEEVTPAAAIALELGEYLRLSYDPAYFQLREDGQATLVAEQCQFSIDKITGRDLSNETLFITPHSTSSGRPLWMASRIQEINGRLIPEGMVTLEDVMQRFIEGLRLERMLGLHDMTRTEFLALEEVVANLPAIKDRLDALAG